MYKILDRQIQQSNAGVSDCETPALFCFSPCMSIAAMEESYGAA